MRNKAIQAFTEGFGESVNLATVLIGGLVLALRRVISGWSRQDGPAQ